MLSDDGGPSLLSSRVDATAAKVGTQLRRPVASLLHLGAAAAISAPLLAAAATHAVIPDLSPERLLFGYPDQGPLQLAVTGSLPASRAALLPALAAQLIDVALLRLLAPFTAALTTAVPLPGPTLAGNILSALAAAARLVEPPEASARARALVDLVARRHPPLRGSGELHWRQPHPPAYFRRRNCCLFYQIPGAGTCGDCILAG